MMKVVGINKVYYSINDDIICERVSQMTSIASSSVMRRLDMIHNNAPTDITNYYLNLFMKKKPVEIRIRNLNYFLKYNFIEVLPDIKYKITKNHFIIYYNNKIINKLQIIQ